MIKWILVTAAMLFTLPSAAQNSPAQQLQTLGYQYFNAWSASQAPSAEMADIETYLSYLTDDVGHQHLPYDTDDTREQSGKENMRKGMKYYLGSHTKHQATLTSITTGDNVIVIKYKTKLEGTHPDSKKIVKMDFDTVEVLEIESGRIAVIRKYSE